MLTTTVAGRTWNFSHAIGRQAAAGNSFANPTALAIAPGGILYVLSRSYGLIRSSDYAQGGNRFGAEDKRIGKLTIDEEFPSDFGRGDFTWPTSLAVSKDGNVYCSDEYENSIAWLGQGRGAVPSPLGYHRRPEGRRIRGGLGEQPGPEVLLPGLLPDEFRLGG